ncbi:RHS repeat-associated core domain-containing protein [Lysobacter yananisis]|uniref:RHS repeat-associated core domain-containing protein n=1 Tax=Lysobacter yananisis TaxID=1003114 RepID=A0ABY9P9B4_9GAMM|nr:RHS repeat-associated core domain-containing protein [Lysobacter yananisis]WMT02953.1 RHS repeat-associated core domain-containing protein [Lysobacter yananisis]
MSRRKNFARLSPSRHPLMAVLAVAVGTALSASVQAQEAGKVWTSDWLPPDPQTTEEGIQNKIKEVIASYPDSAGIEMQVTGHFVTLNKTISKYETVPKPPVINPWVYSDFSTPNPPPGVGSVEALELQIAQRYNQESTTEGCPNVSVIHVSPVWNEVTPWDDGQTMTQGFGTYTGTRSAWTGGQCEIVNVSGSTTKLRDVACPNDGVLGWSDEKHGCVFPIVFTYQSETLAKNECPVGNPCDPTTGDKSEPAPDFDLGWIAFDRHYHSMASVARSGFGSGWTHSHNIQLAMGVDPMDPNQTLNVGLIEADGSQLAFKAAGSAYEAVDGSGDRLVADGTDWLLYRADRVLRFNVDNRLTEQKLEDGTSLSYSYDTARRLTTITHSTGRSLVLEYNGVSEDATIAAVRSAGTALATYSYTAGGQVETVTYADAKTRTYHYEDTRFPRLLTGVTGEDNQRYSTFTYDAKARVTSSSHAGGADAVTLTYPSAGGSTVTDALGAVTTYGMTTWVQDGPTRKISKFSDPVRGDIERTYLDASVDFRRRLSTVKDRRGFETHHSYSEANDTVTGQPARMHSVKEAAGQVVERNTQARTDIASNRTILTVVGNREIRITRNARLQPATVAVRDTTTNEVRTTSYVYCEAADVSAANSACPTLGLLKSVNGPRTDVNDITTFQYFGSDDSTCAATPALCTYRKGDLRKTVDALGRATEVLGYDSQGRPLSVLDANGVVTDYEYTPRGWLTATKVRGANNAVETDDRITRIEHEPTGLVKKVTLPNGVFTTYTYDAAQRLTDVTDNEGNKIHYTLDLAGNRKQEDAKTASGTLRRTLSRVFNTLGQLETLKDAGQNPTGFHYDVNGNQDQVMDALSRATTQSYDPLNRLSVTVQDVGGVGAESKVEYNAFDQVVKVTDPKNLITLYAYNGFGDRTKLTSPDTGVTDLTYNAAGQVATKKDANDAVAHRYTYDALGRPKAVFYTTTGPADVEFDYDTANTECTTGQTFATGRLTATRTEANELKYCYDRFGQVVRKVQIVSGKSFTLSYAYTLAGDLDSITYPDGTTVDYVRDTQARIKEVGVRPSGGTRTVLLNNATYEPFGPVTGWAYGNGRTLSRSYDLDYRPKTILDSASGGLSLGYGYNTVGDLTELKDGLHATFKAKYDYDTLGRLTVTNDHNSNPLDTYTYDKTGNRTSLTDGGGLQAYDYNATGSHRLTAVAGVVRGYDAAGNTTSIGGSAKEFVYSANDRLSQFKQAGVVKASYRYNSRGERVATTGATTTTIDTYTLYDEAGNWIGDYDTTGAPKQQAIWFGDAPVGLVVGAGAGQTLAYVQPDHLGTPRSIIDPARNVAVWAWDAKSEVFGNSPPNQDPDQDGVAFVFNMRFPGQRLDAASGLVYNYFRDYDSATGRYIQSDPIGLSGGASTFGYAGGNPQRFTDIYGLASVDNWENKQVHKIQPPPRAPGDWLGPAVGVGIVAILAPVAVEAIPFVPLFINPATLSNVGVFTAEVAGVSGAGRYLSRNLTGAVAPAVQRYWFEISRGDKRASATQVDLYMQCSTFRRLMIEDGWSWAPSSALQGAGKLTKGGYTYNIYPVSKSTGAPSAKLVTADGYRVANVRFNPE